MSVKQKYQIMLTNNIIKSFLTFRHSIIVTFTKKKTRNNSKRTKKRTLMYRFYETVITVNAFEGIVVSFNTELAPFVVQEVRYNLL
jgi:hypothetical protein